MTTKTNAACYDVDKGNYNSILKMLDKMLKEKKNYEYRDQIYYAKGEMYLSAKDMKKACDNFRSSVSVSKNTNHKAIWGCLMTNIPLRN